MNEKAEWNIDNRQRRRRNLDRVFGLPRLSQSLMLAVAVTLAANAGCSSEEEPAAQIPAGLESLESTAEDAFDLALAGDVAAVRQRAEDLSIGWASYRGQATSDGVSASAISALDGAITAVKDIAAGTPSNTDLARAVNAVSQPMPTFYEVYDPVIPSVVLALDYLGREVMLDALVLDFTRAAADVDQIDATWSALRAEVVSVGGSTEVTAFDDSISSERTAVGSSDGPGLEAAAVAQLELVDGVEKVFADAGDEAD
jgi:hypothetical protein